jgi:hypothetical protein
MALTNPLPYVVGKPPLSFSALVNVFTRCRCSVISNSSLS